MRCDLKLSLSLTILSHRKHVATLPCEICGNLSTSGDKTICFCAIVYGYPLWPIYGPYTMDGSVFCWRSARTSALTNCRGRLAVGKCRMELSLRLKLTDNDPSFRYLVCRRYVPPLICQEDDWYLSNGGGRASDLTTSATCQQFLLSHQLKF